jgi:uncharacterized protein involved in cysteine biosynthesis
MIDAAIRALAQMFSRPFRTVLLKAIGLALVLIVLIGIAVHRLLLWVATAGESWADAAFPAAQTPLHILVWIISIAAGLGIVLGSIFLMPAVTSFVGSFFVDKIAEQVERTHYPADPPGHAVPLPRALWEGTKTAVLAVLVYLACLPFLLLAGLGAIAFFLATGFLLGREYFELAAMRFSSPEDAKALRRRHASTVFGAGLLIALFVSIPIVNLATPLFATALMVHVRKRLAGRTQAIEARR